jgi:hypothetical protein
MGLPDAYPFVVSPPAIDKLAFIHDVINSTEAEKPDHAGRLSLFDRLRLWVF